MDTFHIEILVVEVGVLIIMASCYNPPHKLSILSFFPWRLVCCLVFFFGTVREW